MLTHRRRPVTNRCLQTLQLLGFITVRVQTLLTLCGGYLGAQPCTTASKIYTYVLKHWSTEATLSEIATALLHGVLTSTLDMHVSLKHVSFPRYVVTASIALHSFCHRHPRSL